MSSQIIVDLKDLTNEQARKWLTVNDPEGVEFYVNKSLLDYVGCVADNLVHFGQRNQSGPIFVCLPKNPEFNCSQVCN